MQKMNWFRKYLIFYWNIDKAKFLSIRSRHFFKLQTSLISDNGKTENGSNLRLTNVVKKVKFTPIYCQIGKY